MHNQQLFKEWKILIIRINHETKKTWNNSNFWELLIPLAIILNSSVL